MKTKEREGEQWLNCVWVFCEIFFCFVLFLVVGFFFSCFCCWRRFGNVVWNLDEKILSLVGNLKKARNKPQTDDFSGYV